MSTITDLSQDPAAALDAIGGAVERGASLLAGGSRAAGPATPQDDTTDLVPAPDAIGVAVTYERGFTAVVMVTAELAEDLSGQGDSHALTAGIGPVADEIASALGVAVVSTVGIDAVSALDQHLVGVELLVASGVFSGDAVVGTVAVAMRPSAGPGESGATSNGLGASDEAVRATAADSGTVAASSAAVSPAPAGEPGSAVPPRSATSAAAVADAPPAPAISEAALTRGLSILAEVSLEVTAELGRAALRVSELLDLQPGSIIELDREAGAPVELFVNGTLFARAEVVVVDGQYAVRICELFGGGTQR